MNECWCPLSFSQQMFWFVDRLTQATPACNLPRVVKIKGALDLAALGESFRALVRRHDALRTIFVEQNGELFQRVLDEVAIDLPVQDLSRLRERQNDMVQDPQQDVPVRV